MLLAHTPVYPEGMSNTGVLLRGYTANYLYAKMDRSHGEGIDSLTVRSIKPLTVYRQLVAASCHYPIETRERCILCISQALHTPLTILQDSRPLCCYVHGLSPPFCEVTKGSLIQLIWLGQKGQVTIISYIKRTF